MDNNLSKYFHEREIATAWEFGPDIVFSINEASDSPFGWGFKNDTEILAHHDVSLKDQATMMMQIYTLHLFMKRGPVIVRPDVALCQALVDTEINFNCREYKQPFEIMGVELPREIVGDLYPCLTLVWRPNESVVMGWTPIKDTGLVYYMLIGDDLPTIEDRLRLQEGVDNETDYRMLVLGTRAVLNVCMLASCRQTDVTPLPRPIRNQRQVRNRRERRLALEVFQEVRFRDLLVRPRPHYDMMGGFGGKQSKQKRRGHWRSVPHGPQSSLRKMTWINEYETHPEIEWPGGEPPTTILK